MKKHEKNNKKVIIISTFSATLILIAAVLVFIFAVSPNIIVDDCASPCRGSSSKVCPAVCVKITLFDIITGQN